jgi:hypothetical protein
LNGYGWLAGGLMQLRPTDVSSVWYFKVLKKIHVGIMGQLRYGFSTQAPSL